ncbi:hypothetical protein [Paenibacillus sp. UMB4589-SE434]|uniref:hypothetical protein n=1 Tax=Paenibacillus sp. UMB4589-SE434 TaxID=3046314 RepID=UPI00254F182C|nr:hypothetical protein [Paenibacillus sp. UMB4589-SE434]MDK8183550.1 hypothetical protein [Paenibacillus sp. UMB4589-SE434]
MDFYWGFSWKGFLVVLLPMIPNILYFTIPNLISIGGAKGSHKVLDFIEHGSQFVYMALLVMVVSTQTIPFKSNDLIGMAIFLIAYYVLWILLFTGHKNILVLLCMAIFPVIYFILAEIWLYNYFAIVPTVIFGIVHMIITYKDFISTR